MKRVKRLLIVTLALFGVGFSGCKDDTPDYNPYQYYESYPLSHLSPEAEAIRDYMKEDMIIAHRGSTFWTPEETEAAYRWARNMGADYLELDLQRTKDGVLLALHDNNLRRTSNIASVLPGTADYP